ncbi:MAG: hypothetical protein Q9175_006874 [Cornicularia normoerica]
MCPKDRSGNTPGIAKDHNANLDTSEKHIQNPTSRIPQDGSAVDLQPLFFQFTLDSATDFLFGESVGSLTSTNDNEEASFAAAFDYAQIVVRRRWG